MYGSLGKPRPKAYKKENLESINVLALVEANPKPSVREIEAEVTVSKTKVEEA